MSKNTYGGYEESGRIWFPVANRDERYHPKEKVIGLNLRGEAKAYPFAELSSHEAPFVDHLAGPEITVHFRFREPYRPDRG